MMEWQKNFQTLLCHRDCNQRKSLCMGVGVELTIHNLLYLHSQLSTITTKGKGRNVEAYFYLLSTHVSVCSFPKQLIGKGRVWRWGREGMRADLMSLNRHFMEH